MEQGPEEIKRELKDPVGSEINSESISEMMGSENPEKVVVANETLLVRMVPDKYVRKDQTVTSDAF
ncbi:MAG: hypothetical protein IPJ32_12320 [Sphingobacteriaceae bacterium]|nr:hypothetical protein [Sphingobacteriaceae bacterium]